MSETLTLLTTKALAPASTAASTEVRSSLADRTTTLMSGQVRLKALEADLQR